jgi:hypothetical protein
MRWSLAIVAACYSPRITPGSPCDTMHPCPTELTCSPATHTCEQTASNADAGTPDGMTCYGSGLVHVCFAQPPSGMVLLPTNETIDTTSSPLCMHVSGACVIAGSRVVLAFGATSVVGSNPFVLIGAAQIDITGKLDVSSHRGGGTGPGANPADCALAPASTDPTGGPGGSFGGRGGKGGDANLFSAGAPSGPTIVPTMLRGGCPGSPGNPGGGEAGAGGGAVYLISAGQIAISGTVDASGAGGGGGGSDLGGGGGGAGGLIGLDAPIVSVIGQVFANGGGGGEAGDATAIGNNGADPSTPSSPASGGAGAATNGGDGGNGAAGTTLTGVNGQGLNQGGGGGGGAGVILVFPKQMVGGSISPPPS